MVCTLFWDMRSGGGLKEPYDKIYIEAPLEEAKIIFYNRFKHNPERVTCSCCGTDYSIDESESFEQASSFHRGCGWAYFRPDGTECDIEEYRVVNNDTREGYTGRYVERARSGHEYITPQEYLNSKGVLLISAEEIKSEDRTGTVPVQGYVWQE